MEIEPQPCSHCGADTQKDRAAGLTYCSACGGGLHDQPATPRTELSTPSDADDVADRRRWTRCFWLAFFLTPIAPIVAGAGAGLLFRTFPGIDSNVGQVLALCSGMGTFGAGALSASYCLLRIRNETFGRGETIVQLILQAIGLGLVYLGILFVGSEVLSVFFG